MNKKLTKNLSLLLLATAAGANLSFAAGNYQYQNNYVAPQPQYQQNYYPQNRQNYSQQGSAPTTLKGRVVTVPAGATLSSVVTTPISSEFLVLGQPVNVTLGSDFYYNSSMIAPAGSTVCGTVTQVTKAKHGSMNGSLKLRFTEIVTPYGARVPISAVIKTDDGTGLLKGGTKADVAKAYAKDIGIGAGAGALTGLVAAAISGGAEGKGTAIMTGIGMAGGLAKSVYDKGLDVIIPSNSTVELFIDQPITVNPSGYSYDY
jgi:hypothetical protein